MRKIKVIIDGRGKVTIRGKRINEVLQENVLCGILNMLLMNFCVKHWKKLIQSDDRWF